ncbi:DNA-directed RNA polymerase sigma-70 factor [Allostella sp. ATCC 35155]|nr:DNA-directed RNA polymerase sigma-70 factor [Stella sp. ATCC 35155]
MLELFLSHRSELVDYARRIVGDRAHAEDVVQEAYLRLTAGTSEPSPGEPLAYLYRVVRNLALDVRRRLARDGRRFTDDAGDRIHHLPADRPSPEAEVAARRDLDAVAAALAELPERTRIALEMHRFGGHSMREIARRLGISTGLVHALIVDGLEHCRSRLARR